jgi:endo-1,3(4)-beta-glucanase
MGTSPLLSIPTSTRIPASTLPPDCPDINVPIATTAPPSQFTQQPHPLQPVGLSGGDLTKQIETNKRWGNAIIAGGQQGNMFAFPYTLWWTGDSSPYGMNIMHTEASQRVFSLDVNPQYYYSPVGIVSWNMGATEFDSSMEMKLDTPTQFTVNVNLAPSGGGGSIVLPLVNGMAFVTGIYVNLKPYLTTVGRAILSFSTSNTAWSTKNKVSFNDGTTWLIYAFPSSGNSFLFTQSGNSLVGNGKFTGCIQISKIPIGDTVAEATYDSYSGVYVKQMKLFGSTCGHTGTYGFNFTTGGRHSSSVLHFALPHHIASFDSATNSTVA